MNSHVLVVQRACRLQVGFSNDGKLISLDLNLYNNAGNTLDLSHSVMDRALLHSDNCYKIPNVRAVGHLCKTNTASNTAFRGFGGPQVLQFLIRAVQLECDTRSYHYDIILHISHYTSRPRHLVHPENQKWLHKQRAMATCPCKALSAKCNARDVARVSSSLYPFSIICGFKQVHKD